MITSLFRKSTPLNYALVIIAVTVFFFIYHIGQPHQANGLAGLLKNFGLLVVIFGSLFTANFIVKKNNISRDSSYTILFYLMFLFFFPSLLGDANLLLSGFFIMLALRRLMSLHSLKASKEKIFDASLWICVASLFHFWSILFIVLVFISILFHASRDYRNWILPFMAFLTIATGFLLYAFVFDATLVTDLVAKTGTNFTIDYFTDNKQNIALSIYASVSLYFLSAMLLTLSNRPQMLQSSYKKIISSFVIGVLIFLISPVKSNDLLIYTVAPLSFMATVEIEYRQEGIKEEITLAIVIAAAMFLFFIQL